MFDVNSIRVQDKNHCCVCGRTGKPLYQNLTDRIFSAPGQWSILQCKDCRHLWLHPQPIPEDVPKLYEKYFVPEMEAKRESPRGWRNFAKRSILRIVFGYDEIQMTPVENIIGYALCRIKPLVDLVGGSIRWLHAKKGKLLDVGCGAGQYLDQMRSLGWEVTGLEPNPVTANIGRGRYGLNIVQEPFEKAPFPDDFFEAITLNHVIEHLLDPGSALDNCHRLLKTGGLLIVTTPNNESLGRRIFKSSYISLDPPRHLNIFSKRSLLKLLNKSGLKMIKLKSVASLGYNEWSLSRLLGKHRSPLPANINRLLQYEEKLFQMIERILDPVWNVGEQIALIATKTDGRLS